ncbi:MAG: Fur family transcriptional regulator [Anaerolineae bacterium]
MKQRVDAVCARLRGGGCRVTPQRLAIVESVFASRSHPTAYGVYESLRQRYPTMSLTTVYKTLHLLESLGEVLPLAADTGTAHYDATVAPHVHLICDRCGAIADSDEAPSPALLDAVRSGGWRIDHWRLEAAGLCPACAGNGAAAVHTS